MRGFVHWHLWSLKKNAVILPSLATDGMIFLHRAQREACPAGFRASSGVLLGVLQLQLKSLKRKEVREPRLSVANFNLRHFGQIFDCWEGFCCT